MILLFNLLSKIENTLQGLTARHVISDFKISLRVNNKAVISIFCEDENNLELIQSQLLPFNHDKVELEYLSKSDLASDPYYRELFSSQDKVFLDSRKNLSNLLETNNNIKTEIKSKVVTFYSYKGGVGRSTTLASCASYLSNHFGKKVMIIDCDLEAPGFTNYFLEEPDQVNNHIGVVEFFMDLDFNPENTNISDYVWEIGKDFSGNGSIIVMPAGNLSDEIIPNDEIFGTHKKHYLEGLARIDTSSSFMMNKKFNTLLKQADITISPDIIIIDSRTGFNDIFGITALNISDLVVGLFGTNAQSIPGLNFFLDRIIESKTNLNAVLINSILPRRSSFVKFEEYVESYIQNNTSNEDSLIAIKTFPVTRYSVLETLGTNEENKSDFIDLIANKRFPEYNDIFIHINGILEENEFQEENEITEEIEKNAEHENNISKETKLPNVWDTVEQKTSDLLSLELKNAAEQIKKIGKFITQNDKNLAIGIQKILKKTIKSNLEKSWPSLYGENSTEEMKKNIFFRRSMEDIFNNNKFIILGNKGTGKTFLYEALKFPDIVERIQERANKKGKFEFFHVIDKEAGKFFDTNLFEENLPESFYHRFWIVYIWNAIMLESEQRLGYKSKIDIHTIQNNTKTKNRFTEIVNSDELLIQVEEDLEKLDKFLGASKNNLTLVVIFDGLDQVVKPIHWHFKIVPLINYWRNHGFSRLSPKLFIRSDLFEKLTNITNVKELKNQAISIEWNQEELFGYFFKLVLTSSKEEFFRYMLFTKMHTFELIQKIKQKCGSDNQLPLEEYYLAPLVRSFFGQYASSDNTPRYGESYDWFYRNLKNANSTISLRPFIDLINNSFQYAQQDDNSPFPILPAFYYVHGESRKTSLENHFSDLVSEQGNEILRTICNHIREKKSAQIIYLEIRKNEIYNLLTEIIDTYKIKDTTVEELLFLLKVNGIISENFRTTGLSYSFALLYKYYLGLKTRPRNSSRQELNN
jgi:cellulose biosynthesis protein BcsQ